MTTDKRHVLSSFLDPKSVSLVGVSRETGRGAFNVLENLIEFGYKGKIYPVNPNAQEILGVKTCRDAGDLPAGIDLAVIMTPRDTVPGVVERCAERGINSTIIITEGFCEADEKGRLLQKDIDDIVTKRGIRILGPNSVGVVNSFSDFSSAFMPLPKYLSPVALVSQSGGFFEGFPDCPFGKGIDLGNTSDIGFIDAISYLEKDDDIRVIVLHMEGIKDVRKFIETCRRVTRTKPIIVIKGGRSRSGGMASASHTGSISSNDRLFSAMFRQSGSIQVDSLSDVGNFAGAFLNLPPFTGDRIAVVTPTGAGGIITLDAVERHGFEPAVLSRRTVDGIAGLFQPWIKVKNPIDILSAGMTNGYKHVLTKVLESCLNDGDVDVVVVVSGPYTLKTIKKVTTDYPEKPVVAWIPGADLSFAAEKAELFDFQPYFFSPDQALYALKIVREYYRLKDAPMDWE